MKQIMKRSVAMLLALVLCLSLIPAIGTTVSAATVNYVTGVPSNTDYSYSNIVKNWGKRGTVATFLSPMAEAFYADNDVTYTDMIANAGDSSISAVPSSNLYRYLQDLMKTNHKTETSYDDVRYLMPFTDSQENGTGTNGTKISAIYTGTNVGPGWDSGKTWNREHTWPNSKGLGGADENDIMMLRPESSSENSSRSNTAYGESSGYYDPNQGSYNVHGDVARIMLYTYVRWGNASYMWGAAGVMESKAVLLKWMEEDPVDTWELARNDSVESITGTRNVFVDYPELAFALFNENIPTDMTTPSGEAKAGACSVTATTNNSSYGTVSVSGNVINAFPATGYAATGYTVVSGDATVTQSGNAFTVNATTACTVQIIFTQKTVSKVAFLEDGVIASAQSCYTGDVITLPDHSGDIPDGYTFLGWVTAPLAETDQKPATIYTAGTTYTLPGSMNFYALYTRMDVNGTGSSTIYNPATSVSEGDYLIVSDGVGMMAMLDTGSRFSYESVTIADNAIDSPAAGIIWHIVPTSDGHYTLYNASTGTYAAATGVKNKGQLLTSATSDYAKWDISLGSNGEVTITNVGNKAKGVNYTLRRNANYGFAPYAASTGTGLVLYAAVSGTMYYSTNINGCAHSATVTQNAVAATCTTEGYSGDLYCTECGTVLLYGSVIPAPGHTEVTDAAVAATCTETGLTAGAHCSICGYVITAQVVVPALGHTMGYIDNEDGTHNYACITCGMTEVKNEDHTYIDGVCSACGSSLISYEQATQIAAGDVVVLVCNSSTCELSGISTYGISAEYTDSLDALYPLTVVEGISKGSYAFMTPEGTYLSWASGNTLKTSDTLNANASWTVTFDESGNAIIINTIGTTRQLQWNAAMPRFACYATTQTEVQLYKQIISAPSVCEHTSTTLVGAVAATCTAAGYTGDTVCLDCGETLEEGAAVAALGHKEVVDAAVAPTCTETGLTEGAHCEVCGEVTAAQEEIPANGHQEVTDAAVAPTCTETGLTEGAHCEVCGEVTAAQEEIPANGHHEVTDAAVAPTCTATGLTEGAHCDVCNEITVPQEEIPANGHQEVTDAAVAPTCTETGLTEGAHCDVCGEVTAAQEVIPAKGHDYLDDVCTVCGAAKAVAQIGDVQYPTLAEALDAAVAGDTVELLLDTEEELVYIAPGVTLDLNACTLTAKYVLGLNGSNLAGDNYSTTKAYAKLIVAKDNMALSSSKATTKLPVWMGDHYVFMSSSIEKDTATASEGTMKLEFTPNCTSAVLALMKQNGSSPYGISIVIRVSYTETQENGDINVTREYVYTDELVKSAYKDSKSLTVEMDGCDELKNLVFTIAVVSDAGAENVSAQYTYNDYK